MSEQQGNPGRSVAVAVVLVIIAVAGFAAAFFFLDGMLLVEDLMAGNLFAEESPPMQPSAPGSAVAVESQLTLPDGMPEDFALRLWQEQVDSQGNIERLVNGDITSLVIEGKRDLEGDPEDAVAYDIVAQYKDGTWAPGVLGMRRFGENWYFAYVQGIREIDTTGMADTTSAGDGGAPDTPLPDIEDVDVPLLNTILEQQRQSSQVLEEYATGQVYSANIEDVVDAPGTATLKIVMEEDHETTDAEIVVLEKEIEGRTMWFVARFTRGASS